MISYQIKNTKKIHYQEIKVFLLQKNSMQLVFIDIEASTKEKNNIREVGAIDHSNNFVYQ